MSCFIAPEIWDVAPKCHKSGCSPRSCTDGIVMFSPCNRLANAPHMRHSCGAPMRPTATSVLLGWLEYYGRNCRGTLRRLREYIGIQRERDQGLRAIERGSSPVLHHRGTRRPPHSSIYGRHPSFRPLGLSSEVLRGRRGEVRPPGLGSRSTDQSRSLSAPDQFGQIRAQFLRGNSGFGRNIPNLTFIDPTKTLFPTGDGRLGHRQIARQRGPRDGVLFPIGLEGVICLHVGTVTISATPLSSEFVAAPATPVFVV